MLHKTHTDSERDVISSTTLLLSASSGPIFSQVINQVQDGPILTIWNNLVEGQLRRMSSVCFNDKTGQFAISDECGSVFTFSIVDNVYKALRISTVPVSAMTFVHSRCDQIAIAYENGSVIIVDTVTLHIICNIQLESFSTVRMMRCHPGKSNLALVADDGSITMWDLRNLTCTRSLKLTEGIVDVQFEEQGSIISVLVEDSGLFMYRSSDCNLVIRCVLPKSERKCSWKSYCSRSNAVTAGGGLVDLQLLIAGNNGLIYIWGVPAFDINRNDTKFATLIGVVELPTKLTMAIKMLPLGDPIYAPRIAILTAEGAVVIVDMEGSTTTLLGSPVVVADLPPSSIQGLVPPDLITPLIVHPKNTGKHGVNGVRGEEHCDNKILKIRDGIFASKDDLFIAIGMDGCARLFDSETAIGKGPLCGLLLRTRQPHKNDHRVTNDLNRVATKISVDDGLDNKRMKTINKSIKTTSSSGGDEVNGKGHGHHSSGSGKEFKGTSIHSVPRSNAVGMSAKIMKSLGVSDPTTLALHEIAKVLNREGKGDKGVNHRKLGSYLAVHNEFPDRYRVLIWRYLLRLPENSESFSDLVRRGVHPAYEDLYERYPVRARRVFARLQSTCSQLAHWSPIFAETPYVPALVFPFVVVYGADELATLETVMTIFMWWGFSWHVTFPNPPIHILDSIDNLLKIHDAKLHTHLYKLNVSPGLIGWAMISSMFSEILNRQDWLRLFDFLFLNIEKASNIIITPVALLICMKSNLLNCVSDDSAYQTCRKQQPLSVELIKKVIIDLETTTPNGFFPNFIPTGHNGTRTTKTGGIAGRDSGVNVTETPDDIKQVRESVANTAGSPTFPLSKGGYPAYDGYPRYLVDWQLKEREHAIAMHNEVARREDVLYQLERKIAQIDEDHAHWIAKHEAATQAEIEHKQSIMEKEKMHMRDLQRIEEEISKQRIEALNALEFSVAGEIEVMDKVAAEARKLMSTSEQHIRDKMHIALDIQKHREFAVKAEAEVNERIRQLHLRRTQEEWIKSMQGALKSKEEDLSKRDMILAEKWRQEDEINLSQRILFEKRLRSKADEEDLKHIKQELMERMQKLQMEREAKILEIERSRAVHLAKTYAVDALMASERSMKSLKSHEDSIREQQKAILSGKNVERAQQQVMAAVEMMKDEGERLMEIKRSHAMRQRNVQTEAVGSSDVEHKMKSSSDDHVGEGEEGQRISKSIEAEKALQDQILELQNMSRKLDREQARVMKSSKETAPQRNVSKGTTRFDSSDDSSFDSDGAHADYSTLPRSGSRNAGRVSPSVTAMLAEESLKSLAVARSDSLADSQQDKALKRVAKHLKEGINIQGINEDDALWAFDE